jgi:3D (Asp-Asp-Asp) domain-containing protein
MRLIQSLLISLAVIGSISAISAGYSIAQENRSTKVTTLSFARSKNNYSQILATNNRQLAQKITIGGDSEYLISQSGKSREIDIRKISIGGLKLGMNVNEITKIFGQPRQQYSVDYCGDTMVAIKYNKLDIYTPNHIFTIKTSNPAYATGEGVRVGDPISKAKKVYAKYKSTVSGQYLFYSTNLGESSLNFKINKGLITEITLDEGC